MVCGWGFRWAAEPWWPPTQPYTSVSSRSEVESMLASSHTRTRLMLGGVVSTYTVLVMVVAFKPAPLKMCNLTLYVCLVDESSCSRMLSST